MRWRRDWSFTDLGGITAGLKTPVSIADNGIQAVIVDGSANGWAITLADNTFAQIVDPSGGFRGADRVDYMDTFFLFNVPNTPQFQVSDSEAVTFQSLYFANKSAHSDNLMSLAVAKREIYLIGTETTEVWTDLGTPDFPFGTMPGAFIDRGAAAKYSDRRHRQYRVFPRRRPAGPGHRDAGQRLSGDAHLDVRDRAGDGDVRPHR